MPTYPTFIREMAKRRIKKHAIASSIGICDRALYNKLNGKTPFTWPEVETICHRFFPDMRPEVLLAPSTDSSKAE